MLGHKSMAVAGELWFTDGSPNVIDMWWEYVDENGFHRKFINALAFERDMDTIIIKPKYMFNDKITWRNYNENWYNN